MKKINCDICNNILVEPDKHHIWSKSLGGPNALWNICNICPNCHKKVHLGKLIIEGWFKSTKGRVLIWRSRGEESITNIKEHPVYLYGTIDAINNPYNPYFKNKIAYIKNKLNTFEYKATKPILKYKNKILYNYIVFKVYYTTKKELINIFKNNFKLKGNKLYVIEKDRKTILNIKKDITNDNINIIMISKKI